jgi:hypothetical protein
VIEALPLSLFKNINLGLQKIIIKF